MHQKTLRKCAALIVSGNDSFLENDVAVKGRFSRGNNGVSRLGPLVELEPLQLVEVDLHSFSLVANGLVLGPNRNLKLQDLFYTGFKTALIFLNHEQKEDVREEISVGNVQIM